MIVGGRRNTWNQKTKSRRKTCRNSLERASKWNIENSEGGYVKREFHLILYNSCDWYHITYQRTIQVTWAGYFSCKCDINSTVSKWQWFQPNESRRRSENIILFWLFPFIPSALALCSFQCRHAKDSLKYTSTHRWNILCLLETI